MPIFDDISAHAVPEMLQRARLAAGLTQSQVAALLGITRQEVSNWETGVREPGAQKFFDLMLILRAMPKKRHRQKKS